MVKSHVLELVRIYRVLFEDFGNAFPCERESFRKDYERLVVLSAERGINLFCVDLPAVGKHLDRCLSEGLFSVSGLPLTGRCPRCIMYPEFLSGLWSRIFDEDGCLKEDCDVESVVLLRQAYYLAKKVQLDCPNECVLNEVKEFVDIDAALPEPEQVWYQSAEFDEVYKGFLSSVLYQERASESPQKGVINAFLRNLDLVSGIVASTLGPYKPSDWKFRHGPGAVSERKGTVNKFQFVNWSPMLETVYPYADYAFHSYASWAGAVTSTEDELVSYLQRPQYSCTEDIPYSRLVAVPKTISRPRLIAAEPSEHMWCQQNIWHYLRHSVSNSWIAKFVRFTDQTRNQELCRIGSVDGSLATLDLSSASDRVTCHFVGNLFRSNIGLLKALRATRTQVLEQSISGDCPKTVVLKKFSTMGSACTFPIETLGFMCIALAAVATKRQMRVSTANLCSLEDQVTIFGDDIIVPEDCRELVIQGLEICDFKVNTGKSFWNGKFRESCGVDAYRGTDVTPVYWRTLATDEPESTVSAIEVRNSFYKKGLWATAAYLTSTIRRDMIPTVRVGSGVFGFETFGRPRIDGFYRRYNVYLHRDEVRCTGISSKRRILETNDDSVLLQFFTENPEPHHAWQGGVGLRPKIRLSLGWHCTSSVVS